MSHPLNVLLGVTGGIAAFKAPLVVRALRERGHSVRCAVTPSASAFVTPLTLEALTAEPVYGEEYLTATGRGEELHLTAAQWADVFCVAPLTANTLARLALGLADDFLSTTALMYDGPMVVAPAMHTAMWSKPTVGEHVETLRRRGVHLVGPEEGALASGESGMGRMSDPETIVEAIEAAGGGREWSGPLGGRRMVVTAGPTIEPIDPVRYLTNRSSGRMGFAVAEQAALRGARVVLVAGPTNLPTPAGVERVDVRTAAEMKLATEAHAGDAEVVVMTAAVADFRPRRRHESKLKKSDGLESIELEPTDDILAGLRDLAPDALLVGFAAETDELESEALAKLRRKRLDLIVANDVSRADIGFESEDNEVTVYAADGERTPIGKRSKRAVADALVDLIEERCARGSRAVARDR